MNSSALISIIVPIYNSANYLEKCLESLVNQTYKCIQIILVNDGSTDESLTICKEFQANDNRIMIINQKNRGRSQARNVGLSRAGGDYLMFVDSDDYVNTDFCQIALSSITEMESDIAFFDYYTVDSSTDMVTIHTSFQKSGLLTKSDALTRLIPESFLVNKIYKRALFEGIHFPVGKNYEDLSTCYKVVNRANRISYTQRPTYYYVQHNESITHRKTRNSVQDYFEAKLQQYRFFTESYPNIAKKDIPSMIEASFFYLAFWQDKRSKLWQIANKFFMNYPKKRSADMSPKFFIAMKLYSYFPYFIGMLVRRYFS